MSYAMDGGVGGRVEVFFSRVGEHLPRIEQRESFATYASGILAEGDRKSVEPMAARASGEPEETCRVHDRLLHFVRESPWSDREVRREAARYVVEALSNREPIEAWIIDDTGMLKQGKHSPGVQRQYTGSAGKIANCQLAVSLSVATRTEQVPIDFELYMPESWTSDVVRRMRARVPEELVFKTKIELAMDMIARAVEDGIPGKVVLADSAYGRSSLFRNTIFRHGLDYAVAIDADARVHELDARGRRRGEELTVRDLAAKLEFGAFRRFAWREGTKRQLDSHFVFRRVQALGDDDTVTWLVIEWRRGEREANKFFLTSLPRRLSKTRIIRTIMERWKTERAYQELKGELGFDHFEGRSFIGWHHHVTVVLCCYAFVVAERARAFFPSARRTRRALPVAVAA